MHGNREYIFRIIQAGAHGYVSKGAPPEELVRAIESICAGKPFFSPEVARAALDQLVNSGGKKEPFNRLTQRERDIVQLIVDGHSNKALAAALGIAHQTAKNHVRHVMAKLRVTSRVQLVAWALERGYVPTQTAATA